MEKEKLERLVTKVLREGNYVNNDKVLCTKDTVYIVAKPKRDIASIKSGMLSCPPEERWAWSFQYDQALKEPGRVEGKCFGCFDRDHIEKLLPYMDLKGKIVEFVNNVALPGTTGCGSRVQEMVDACVKSGSKEVRATPYMENWKTILGYIG